MRRTELLDSQQVRRHADAGAARIPAHELVEDGAVLALRLAHRAAVADRAPQARAEGTADERVDERCERWVAAREGDRAVELGVGLDELLEVHLVLVLERPEIGRAS